MKAAAIAIGSNSVRCLLAETGDGVFNRLWRDREGTRLFAGLDVFEQEPLPAEDPVWDLPNLVITPHAAGNMALSHTVDRIVEMFLEDLDNFAAHRPLKHTVDRCKGY